MILYLAPGTSEENVLDGLPPLFPYSPTTGTPKQSLSYPMISLSIPLGMVPMSTVILVLVLVVLDIDTSGRVAVEHISIKNCYNSIGLNYQMWRMMFS